MRCTIVTLVLLTILGNHTISYAMEYQNKGEYLGKDEQLDEDVTLVCKGDEEVIVPHSIIEVSEFYKKSLSLDIIAPDNKIDCPDLSVSEIVLLIPLCNALLARNMRTVKERLTNYTKKQLLILGKIGDYLDIPLLVNPLAEALVFIIQNPEELMHALEDDEESDKESISMFALNTDIQQAIAHSLMNDNPLKRTIVEHGSGMTYCCKDTKNSESIVSACWSSDSNYIALQSSNVIRVEDRITGKYISSFADNDSAIVSINWGPYDDYVCILDASNTIYSWNFISGEIYARGQLKLHVPIKSAYWSTDSNYLAARLIDNSIIVFDAKTGEPLHSWHEYADEQQEVEVIRWSPDGRYIAFCVGNAIHLWETQTWTRVQTLYHNSNRAINVCEWSADNCYIASGSYDGKLCIWETHTWQHEATLPHKMGIQAMSFNHDGTYLASVLFNNVIHVWHIKAKKKCYTLDNIQWVNKIYWSPDGNTILVIFPNYNICLWDVKNIYVFNNLNLEQALFFEILKNTKNANNTLHHRKMVSFYKKNSDYLSSIFASLSPCLRQVLTKAGMGLTAILAGMNILSKNDMSFPAIKNE